MCASAAALLVLLMATQTHAEWRPPLAVPGSPTNVLDVWSPGTFSVGFNKGPTGPTAAGAYLFVDGVATHKLVGTDTREPAGAFYRWPEDCLATVLYGSLGSRDSANAMDVPCLGSNAAINDPSGSSITQVKHARGGGAVAVGTNDPSAPTFLLSDSNIYGTDFLPLAFNNDHVFTDIPPGVVRVDDKTVEVFIPSDGRDSAVYRVVGVKIDKLVPNDGGLGLIQAVEAFTAGSPVKSYVVLGTEHGFIQGPGISPIDGKWEMQQQQALDGGLGVASVAMNVEAGGPAGHGFGMAVLSGRDSNGHSVVMSALPMSSDTQAGTVWRRRAIPPDMEAAPLQTVACAGASYCVFAADAGTAPNLYVYTNDAGPELKLDSISGASLDGGVADGSVSIDESSSGTLVFSAPDPDGDPVLMTAPDSGLAEGLASLSSRELTDGGLAVDLTTGSLCTSSTNTKYLGTLHVQATDGLLEHEAHSHLAIYGVHTLVPPQPEVRLSNGQPVSPSDPIPSLNPGEALTFQAVSLMTAAHCKLTPLWEAVASGAEAPSLQVDSMTGDARLTHPADFCAPDEQSFEYQLRVRDDAGLTSPPRTFIVHLEPNWRSITQGYLGLTTDPDTSSGEVVDLSTDLNCTHERGLSADLQLTQVGGAGLVLPVMSASVPGKWTLPTDLGCRHFLLTGSLRQSDGLTSSAGVSLDLPGRSAGLNDLPDQVLKAQCGEQLSTTLVASFPTETCQTPDVTWTQRSGPPLVQSTLKGSSPTLTTRDTGFELLADQPLMFDVTADSGSDSDATVTKSYTLPITVDPFVKVSHRTELPAASETDFIGVFTELKNTASCDVAKVQYDEQLEGLTYVEGSARFNGTEVDATWNGTTLSARNLTLAGGATGTLTYLARPHLVGVRHIQGEARVGTVTISQSDAVAPPASDSGCGCTSSAGTPPVLLALGVLLAAARRRRA